MSPFYFPDITWRCTVKPNRVYLHLINWPGAKFRFEGLLSDVKKAYFLANKKSVKFRRDGDALEFTLPAKPVDPYNTLLVLEIADASPRVADGFRADQLPKRLDLYAWVARLRGEEIRYDKASMSASQFRKVPTERNELLWYLYEALQGDYDMEITYACADADAGSDFRFGIARSNNAPARQFTAKIEGTKGEFATKKIAGVLSITKADQQIAFTLPDDDKSANVRVRKVTLIRRG